jgi:hypothetical protein
MFVPCINSIKALFIFHNDAHNYKITGILKQLKIPTVTQTCFGSRRNHYQGAIFVLYPHNRLVRCHDIDHVTNDEDIQPQL